MSLGWACPALRSRVVPSSWLWFGRSGLTLNVRDGTSPKAKSKLEFHGIYGLGSSMIEGITAHQRICCPEVALLRGSVMDGWLPTTSTVPVFVSHPFFRLQELDAGNQKLQRSCS